MFLQSILNPIKLTPLQLNRWSMIYNFITYVVLFIVISNRLLSSVYLELNFAKHLFQNLTSLFALINLIIFIKHKQYLYVYIALIALILGVIVKIYSSSSVILFFVSFTLAFSRLNYKYAMYVYIASIFTFTLATFSFFYLDLFDHAIFMMRGDNIRETFGFRHPNALGAVSFFLCLTIWCLSNRQIHNIVAISLSFVIFIFLQNYVDSRTAQHMLCLLLLIAIVYELAKYFKFNEDGFFTNFIVKNLLVYSFIILAIAFIIFVILFNSESSFYNSLDELFSSRLSLCHTAFNSLDITLFGQKLNLSDEDPFSLGSVSAVRYLILDPFCISILFKNGIVSLVFFALCFTYISKKAISHKEYKIAIAIALISIYGLMENMIATISYDIFIFMGMMSFNKFTAKQNITNVSSGR